MIPRVFPPRTYSGFFPSSRSMTTQQNLDPSNISSGYIEMPNAILGAVR
jgi:hypothetical protein